jgi:Uncharacterized protein conserved in bacteria
MFNYSNNGITNAEDKNIPLPEEPTIDYSISEPSDKGEKPPKANGKKLIKRLIGISVLLLILYGGFRFCSFYTSSHRSVQQIYLIPKDAIFMIQSDSPVADWSQLSKSEPWKCLKQSPSFAEMAQKAETLDSILHANKRLMSLVGKRDLMISAHKVRSNTWDFLCVIDLQKVSEIELLKEQIETVYTLMDYKVTYRTYQGVNIIELTDKDTRDILYTAFVENHYVASYTSKLVEASIDERNNPTIGLDPLFIEANKLVAGKGLYRVYIQYAYVPELLAMYMGNNNEYLPIVSQSMAYAGLSLQVANDKMELKGYTFLNDNVDPYVSALLHSGKKEMQAHQVLSDRTAFYTHIGFDNPVTFVGELEKALSIHNPAAYNTYKTSYGKIESMFDISLADDFLSWMSGEFAIVEMEPGLLGHETEIVLAIRAKDIGLAKDKMGYIERKIKRRTPVSIKAALYKGYQVNYVELKGFFALFFSKMFDKFEKPYYTYIDDYVIFSNKPASLLSLIEDYEQKKTLKNDPGFKQILSQIDKKSTYLIYTNTGKFLPLLKPVLNRKSWNDLYAHREVAYSFPYSAFQIIGDQERVGMQMVMNYLPYQEVITEETENEEETDAFNLNEIDELNRFYAEKFQGNIYREFYPENALKSECEIRDGRRHGRYHEYYEDGSLKVRGKYLRGQPRGTWKYYTREGKLERKERENGTQ